MKSLDKKKIKYGEPCPECGLSWAHGSVKCSYPYPSEPKDYGSTGQTNQKLLDKNKPKELDRTTEISIGELNRNKLVDEITSKELSKPKELEYVITWVMAKANGIDDYNWGQKQFEKDLRKKLELLLTQQRTELLEEILNLECLKEEKITKNIFSITQLESRNKIRNQIKNEIKKL